MTLTPYITGRTRVYGILGFPISHTFSPPLQNSAFQATRIDAAYLPFEVKPEALSAAIEGIRGLQMGGVNVTIPYKVEVLPFLDKITPIARMIGAVNTIRNDEGCLIGTNTDGRGFVRSLSRLPFAPENQTILILGAGGSARSILVALAEARANRIFLVNRTPEKAQQLAEEFSPYFPGTEMRGESLANLVHLPVDLLINTTSVGMEDYETPVDLAQFRTLKRVADIIYNPRQTMLLKQAEQLKIPFINGIGMLLHQGCEAFEFWMNQEAPVASMEKQLLSMLR